MGHTLLCPKQTTVADLVVSDIMAEATTTAPSTATSTPPAGNASDQTAATGAAQPTAVVKFSVVNLYPQPGQSATVVGTVTLGHACAVLGRDPTGAWLLVDCGGEEGWVDRRLVDVKGSAGAIPVVTPAPTPNPLTPAPTSLPTATPGPPPPAAQGWQVAYFANANLEGSPVAYDDVPAINFNWGYGSPNPAVPVDYFSARYERLLNLQQGYYRISALADDGVRIWVDNELLMDEWHGATGTQYVVSRWLAGTHQVRVEYMELVGLASIQFSYDYSTTEPPWNADYYGGALNRTGLLHTQREQAGTIQLDRYWGANSPVSGKVPADNWSGRWGGLFQFDNGNYVFRSRSDDGVRVFIDQTLVIEGWRQGYSEQTNRFMGIGAGAHTITVDYFDLSGNAILQVWWYRDTSAPGLTP